MKNKILDEFSIIKEIRKWLEPQDIAIPVGDDAAGFFLNNDSLSLLTSDSLVENVHFKLESVNPVDLGYKALMVNISDIAAMGGDPLFATISLGLPLRVRLSFIKQIYKGIKEAADMFSISVVGGNITSANELMINISLLGQAEENKVLRRNNAQVNDLILVTGTLGSSRAGLEMVLNPKLNSEQNDFFLKKHFRPMAKIEEAKMATKIGIRTGIDISDGLVSDCQHLCEESDVGCRINANKVPIHNNLIEAAKSLKISPLNFALSGGEDYELLFTAPQKLSDKLTSAFADKNWPISVIGEIITQGTEVVDKNNEKVSWQKGYEHRFN